MQAHDLARHLQAAGHEVVVVTTTPGPTELDGVRIERVPLPATSRNVPFAPVNVPFSPSAFQEVARRLREARVEVAHFHGGILSPLAFKGAADSQAAGVPTVITTHCLWSYATPLFRLLDQRTGWSRWPVVFSAVSDVAAAPIRRIVGPSVEVSILPNGIDTAWWSVEPAPRPADVFTVAAVMRLTPRKRPIHLLRILRRVAEQLGGSPRLRAVIVGDGPVEPSMRRMIAASGLEDVVELPGRWSREQIRSLYAEADAFIAPANLESFGIAPLEARCAGVPVVAKARTGVREFVEHGREGLLGADDAELVELLLRLARDRELRREIAEHNRSVPPRMDWTRVVELNLEAYERARSVMAAHRDPHRLSAAVRRARAHR